MLTIRLCETVGFSSANNDASFGQSADASVKAKIINLIASVRMVMRSMFPAGLAAEGSWTDVCL